MSAFTTLISAAELQARLADENVLIFDCRFDLADTQKGESLYTQSHLPGAIYAHLDHHLSSSITAQSGRHPMPDQQKLVEWLASCGMSDGRQVVVYDDAGGAMASRLWWLLKCLGHQAVALLDGGWQQCVKLGFEVNGERPEPVATAFSARLNADCVVSTETVLNNIETRQFALVDVRADFRFRGDNEPIDPVAGHIPGAVNIPLTDNLDAQGCYKSAAELQALYADVLQQYSPARQVYMCGSGVTACHSVLAMAILSGEMPRVYAGSWSAWIRDPARPVASE